MSEEKKEERGEDGINIAMIGSKNRVCLPPDTCSHLHANQGDHLVFILKHTKLDKKPYVYMMSVKPGNFEINEAVDTMADVIKKNK